MLNVITLRVNMLSAVIFIVIWLSVVTFQNVYKIDLGPVLRNLLWQERLPYRNTLVRLPLLVTSTLV